MFRPILVAAVLALAAQGTPAQDIPACDPEAIALMTGGGPHIFKIEIADDPAEQARGLMFRPRMAADAGMLFIYEPAGPASFWMQNTMIPLDMIFIDATGRVESVAVRRDTYSQRVSKSQGPVRAVLEINAGLSAKLGIGAGTQAVHAAFDAAPEEFRCPAQ